MAFQHLVDGCQTGILDVLHLERGHRRGEFRAVYILIANHHHVVEILCVLHHLHVDIGTVTHDNFLFHTDIFVREHFLLGCRDMVVAVGICHRVDVAVASANRDTGQRVVVVVGHYTIDMNELALLWRPDHADVVLPRPFQLQLG